MQPGFKKRVHQPTDFMKRKIICVGQNRNKNILIKEEQYCDYLGRAAERTFIDKDGIESADATVTYDEGTEQYAIELSLKTNGKVDKGQIEDYKTFLGKIYTEVTLVVDVEELIH